MGALLMSGCSAQPTHPDAHAEGHPEGQLHADLDQAPKPTLGLMTSLPLYWPLEADFEALASGDADVPVQRNALEQGHDLVLLDTLSPIASMTQGAPDEDPLAQLSFLAVIQPRVLTPSDNVALDDWVRQGGQLLLVLDPFLAGHYALPLGDPRRPVEAALVPPVLERWGLSLQFDEAQAPTGQVQIEGTPFPTMLAGTLREIAGDAADCQFKGEGLLGQCTLGQGKVTVIADAEIFKDDQSRDGHGHQNGAEGDIRVTAIQALINFAFETR